MLSDHPFDSVFLNELNSLLSDYKKFLIKLDLSKATADKHSYLVSAFLWFLDGYTQVQGFEDITKAQLNSKFRAFLTNQYTGEFTGTFSHYALKGFFSFIYEQHGISTPLLKKEFNLS